jgi:S-DNA-T family DNA segregation ATPase FtsK/SpoIIIE
MQELLNYQADHIERICAAQGLPLRIVGGTVGPRLMVFRAVKPAAIKLAAVLRMEEEIALALGVDTCRIARDGHYLTIEVPRRDPTPVRLQDLLPKVPHGYVAAPIIGVDREGTLLLLQLPSPNVAHVLICGTTGSGKTALARAMIASLAVHNPLRDLGLVLIDPKRRGYAPFAGLPHLLYGVIHEPAEALGVLAWAVDELERRDREGRSTPRLVVFIDELADLMQTASEDAEASLTRLVQRGREAGIHVVACTQKPTTSVIGSLVKANFPCRIVGRVTDPNDAYVATGMSGTGAERLLGKGDFLVVTGGDVVRTQAAYICEKEVADLVTRLRGGRPTSTSDAVSADSAPGAARGKILDFVQRYRERRNGQRTSGKRGGHNRKPPTEAMIEFALTKLKQDGTVSQLAVRRFHQQKYGTDCNPRRAKAAIEAAFERLNGKQPRGADVPTA